MLVGTAEALQPVNDFLIRYIIRILCKYKKVEIVAGVVCADHVHLCESVLDGCPTCYCNLRSFLFSFFILVKSPTCNLVYSTNGHAGDYHFNSISATQQQLHRFQISSRDYGRGQTVQKMSAPFLSIFADSRTSCFSLGDKWNHKGGLSKCRKRETKIPSGTMDLILN